MVTLATQEGLSAACTSLTDRRTKEQTEGQTAGGEKEEKNGGEPCFSYVCL